MKMQMGTSIEDVKYSDDLKDVFVTIAPAPDLRLRVSFPNSEETANIVAGTDGFNITLDMAKLMGGTLALDKEAQYYNNQERDAGTGEQTVSDVNLTAFDFA